MRRVSAALAGVLLVASFANARDRALGEQLAEAQALLQTGMVESAIARLEELSAKLPDDPSVQALLGRALVLNREFDAAQPLLQAAVAGGHGDFGTRLTLASVFWENGLLDSAEALYREAAEASGGDPAALYPLAKLLLWRGEASAAVPLLARVREARPRWPDVSLDYARALEQSGRPAEALEQAAAFVAGAPEHSEGLYTLATILRQLDRVDDAAAALARFEELQAEDRERTLNSGRRRVELEAVEADLARREGAAALARLAALAEDIETLRLKARALELEGRGLEALRTLEQAVAVDPSRADVRVELQEAYRRLGDSE